MRRTFVALGVSSGVAWSVAGVCALAMGGVAVASPFGSSVVSYSAGSGTNASFNDPSVALGEPSRFTPGEFGGAVTPFAAPFRGSQVVSIGVGGQLTVGFAQPVTNDPLNPFGVDLLVFGNSFFFDPATFGPTANAVFGNRGQLEVSPDGVSWTLVPSIRPDGVFPTLGYSDLSDPYSPTAGSVPTDFTRPVDPAFAWQGLGMSAVVAGYAGSGGGAGVDIGALGLSEISFVRVTVPTGETGIVNIDGFSDVAAIPTPGTVVVLGLACFALRRRRGGR